MPSPEFSAIKARIGDVAAFYGIEIVGYLKLDRTAVIPEKDIDLLKGVQWSDGHVRIDNVQDPAQIMPGAKAMIILGKRLQDDRHDVYYRISDRYTASVEMMVLDMAFVCAGCAERRLPGHGVYFITTRFSCPRRARLDRQVTHVRSLKTMASAAPGRQCSRTLTSDNIIKLCRTIPAGDCRECIEAHRSGRLLETRCSTRKEMRVMQTQPPQYRLMHYPIALASHRCFA
jgi:hypothetical protein